MSIFPINREWKKKIGLTQSNGCAQHCIHISVIWTAIKKTEKLIYFLRNGSQGVLSLLHMQTTVTTKSFSHMHSTDVHRGFVVTQTEQTRKKYFHRFSLEPLLRHANKQTSRNDDKFKMCGASNRCSKHRTYFFFLLLLFCFGPNDINQCAIFRCASDESESFIHFAIYHTYEYAVRLLTQHYHHHHHRIYRHLLREEEEEEKNDLISR